MSTQLEALRRFLGGGSHRHMNGHGGGALIVGSGKGGSGTSLVSAILALTTAAEGRRTLLIDADQAFAMQHLLFGVEGGPGLAALRAGAQPEDLLITAAPNLELISCTAPTEDYESRLSIGERAVLMRRLRSLYTDFDQVIVDAGSRLDGLRAVSELEPGRLLAITTTDRVALAATHALVKASFARNPIVPVQILFNRTDEIGARGAFELLARGTNRFLKRTLEFIGAIPTDPDFFVELDSGVPISEAATGTEFLDAMVGLAAQINQEQAHLPLQRVVPG